MPNRRSYKLLCPISRALDRVGDRWSLLILRDLLAGPARFSELQRGLVGIAANLLTDRLATLKEDGLIAQTESDHGVTVYRLTPLGERSSDIIFELARFGAAFPPVGKVVKPGNLRTVATTLGAAANRVATPELDFDAVLVVDRESIALSVANGVARAEYRAETDADLILETSYSALLDLTEGRLSAEEFQNHHSKLDVRSPEKLYKFNALLSGILAELRR